MHIDHTLVETTTDLIKLASDKGEQLQASADQIQRLVCAELQHQGAPYSGVQRPYTAQLANVEEDLRMKSWLKRLPLQLSLSLGKQRIASRDPETILTH